MTLPFGSVPTNINPEFNNTSACSKSVTRWPWAFYRLWVSQVHLVPPDLFRCGVLYCQLCCIFLYCFLVFSYVSRSKYSSDLLNDSRIALSNFSGSMLLFVVHVACILPWCPMKKTLKSCAILPFDSAINRCVKVCSQNVWSQRKSWSKELSYSRGYLVCCKTQVVYIIASLSVIYKRLCNN